MTARDRAESTPVARDEVERLRRWKAEALPVISGLQELGHVLGVGLGRQITGPEAVAAAESLLAERDRAVAQVAAVRALHVPVDVMKYDDVNGVFVYENDEPVILTRLCRECSTDDAIEAVGDCEWREGWNSGDVQWPCATLAALDTAPASPTTDQRCALCGDDDPSDCDTHGLCCDPCHDDPHREPTTDQRIEARQLSGEHVGKVVVLPEGTRGVLWFLHHAHRRLDDARFTLLWIDESPQVVLAPSDVVTLIGGEE